MSFSHHTGSRSLGRNHRRSHFESSLQSILAHSIHDGATVEDGMLILLACTMKQMMPTGDRRKNWFKKYADCFTGLEAVEWMLKNKEANSVKEAIYKGQAMLAASLIRSVDKNMTFYDSRKLLFRFTPSTLDRMQLTRRTEVKCSKKNTQQQLQPFNPVVRKRAMAALIGAFVAEAASVALNGTSTPEKLFPAALVQGSIDFAFCQEATGSSYKSTAESSTGFEARVLLQCLSKRGVIDGALLSNDVYWGFQSNRRLLSSSARHFMENMQNGKTWPQCGVRFGSIDVLSIVPIVVALYAGTDLLFSKLEESVKVFSKNSSVQDMAFIAAFILEQIILGASIPMALQKCIKSNKLTSKQRKIVCKAFTKTQMDSYISMRKFGTKGDKLPSSFCAVLQPLFSMEDYPSAVRENILAGGRSCRRSMFIGACFGAQDGLSNISLRWKAKTPYMDLIEADIMALLSFRQPHNPNSLNADLEYFHRRQELVLKRQGYERTRGGSNESHGEYEEDMRSTPLSCASKYSYVSSPGRSSTSSSSSYRISCSGTGTNKQMNEIDQFLSEKASSLLTATRKRYSQRASNTYLRDKKQVGDSSSRNSLGTSTATSASSASFGRYFGTLMILPSRDSILYKNSRVPATSSYTTAG